MKTVITPAIVVQVRAVREADTMLVLLSQQHGRVSAYARNSRKSQKRFMGGLDLFDCCLFELADSRHSGQVFNVDQVKKREHWPALRENLKKYAAACFCLELTCQFAQDDDHDTASLFSPLYKCLKGINQSKDDSEALTLALYYNLVLLKLSGFNFVDDDTRINPDSDLHRWFEEMIGGEKPIVPYDEALLRQGLHGLVTFSQEILGRELRSASVML